MTSGANCVAEAPITETDFPLEAGECVFLVRGRMKKDREFAPDRLEAVTLQLLGTGAHHDPIPLLYRSPEETIPNRATDQVDFHACNFTREWSRPARGTPGIWMPLIRLLLGFVLLGGLCGCGTLYVMQAANGQWHVMHAPQAHRQGGGGPGQSAGAAVTRSRRCKPAREFASRELKLPDNRSYRTYADLHRQYVVWNVVAAPEFSVQSETVVFPDRRLRGLSGLFRGKESAGIRRRARAKRL